MKRFGLVAILTLTALIPPVAQGADSSMCDLATKAMRDAVQIRGLEAKNDVPCMVHDRTQIESFIRNLIKTRFPADKLHMEERLYKALGVVPENYAYAEGVIDIYVNQLGGYYDPERKSFVMAKWMPPDFQSSVAVHELTHALQDQYYNLDKVLDPTIDDGDTQLAHAALVEGDATAVMTDFAHRVSGAPMVKDLESVDALVQQMSSMVFEGSRSNPPEALRAIVLFPYTSGLRFVHALLRSGGYSKVDDAFRKLPVTTTEILHPEKYLSRELKLTPFPNERIPTPPRGGTLIYSDTLGEFVISSLLGTEVDSATAEEAAAGWLGDRAGIFRDRDGKLWISWIVEWETDLDARQFSEAYLSTRSAQQPGAFSNDRDLTRIGTHMSGTFSRSGRVTTVLVRFDTER